MTSEVIYVDKKSGIPLFGVDFIGAIDRGTNIIELKPLTLCNLQCRYCFVSAGDYDYNFIVDSNYLLEKVKRVIEIKGKYDIEMHLAPYGEILLYPDLFKLIENLWNVEGVKTISMQTNGLLLSKNKIKKLEAVNLSRINISLNTLNREMADYLCKTNGYNMNKLLKNIQILLNSNVDLLIAPVWFSGKNDKDIKDIIEFIVDLRNKGYSEKQVQIGIQNYLIYKTGRKLKKVRPKTWDYFYKRLTKLEKEYNIKLKLGPKDFGIHKRNGIDTLKLEKNDVINLKVVSKGRWSRECIGKINEEIGIKILLKKPLISNYLVGEEIKAKIIKANYKDNILTAVYPF
ncbi:MAG: radical SAM protein [Candidatus Hodarchaeota archaeon]